MNKSRAENSRPRIVGRWFDKKKYVDGHVEFGQHGEFEWGFNQIQNSFATLLAAWAYGDATYLPISFIDIGSGLTAWDTTAPTQSYDDSTLTTAYFRKAISPLDIGYLDPVTDLPSVTTTSKLEIVATILTSEAAGAMREFGLFGGVATAALDSGSMVNWIVHSRIDKDATFEIERTIRLEFLTQ